MKARTRPARSSLIGRARDDGMPPHGGPPPRVSVIIPTYNRAGLVVRAIESVLRQTFCDFELIVVDDASPDETATRVAAIGDPRLRLVRLSKNRGQSHASNAGIARARGEWVAFLDDDDEWLPNKLELQLARVEREQDPRTNAVYCRCYTQKPEALVPPRPRLVLAEGDVTQSLLTGDQSMTPSVYMVRRSALLDVGGFDESLIGTQDVDLWLRMSQAGHHFVIVPEPLTIYHEDDATSRLTNNAVAQALGFIKMRRRWGSLMQERAPEYYDRWIYNRTRKLQRAHDKLVARLVRRGGRRDALRYVRAMAPTLPWSRPFVLRAVTVVLLGRVAARLPDAPPPDKPG